MILIKILFNTIYFINYQQGGLKAVVWTDAFQTVIIILGILITTATATINAGGVEEVWAVAMRHGRINAFE